jgi:hypothetical protein
MSKLNKNILYLIFEELQYDKNALHSCLLVNKIWCETIVPILWKNPWKYLIRRKVLLKVILSHLSDELKNNLLKNKGIRIFYQGPLFKYISFCRHLNLSEIDNIISIYKQIKIKVNENTKCTHLYILHQFGFQIQLISGAKRCFSNLEFFHCNTDNILVGLSEICDSIKELELSIKTSNNNYGIVTLIKAQKKLFSVRFLTLADNCPNANFLKITLPEGQLPEC